jgi:alginate O-acetyltransferase complex protein AlgI
MLLTNSTYFVFLIAIFALYWPFARIRALSLAVILFANYFFYAKWDLFYLYAIPAVSTVDFLIGLGLGRFKWKLLRRALVGLSVLMNLSLMASLKYMPFLFANYAWLTGRKAPAWHWSLPLGVSFYCFQALTYTIDVYRRDVKPARSLLAHLAAVSFFPTTLAGPITRVGTLLTQFEKKDKRLDPAESGKAFFLIGLGLSKKFLIADFLGANLVDRVFDTPALYSSSETLLAVIAYAFQLYYDFSGYTDIAIGSALLLGIRLPINFKRPYAAESVADFWRRWHISLSHWLRDYLYFSLPGKRSKFWPHVNMLITMLLGGLWHGASWNFVFWGLLHGIGISAARLWQIFTGKTKPVSSWPAKIGCGLGTFSYVTFAWVFFRAPDFPAALAILERIGAATVSFANLSAPFVMVFLVAAGAHYMPDNWYEWCLARYVRAPFYVQAAAMALLVLGLENVTSTGAAPFIYQRF